MKSMFGPSGLPRPVFAAFTVAITSAFLAGPAAAQDVDCANAEAQVELNFCAEAEFLEADDDLNLAYSDARDLMRQIDADLSAEERGAEVALRDGQRAWITFRDETCLAESYVFAGGSAQPMVYSGCQARLTQQRAAVLWDLVSEY